MGDIALLSIPSFPLPHRRERKIEKRIGLMDGEILPLSHGTPLKKRIL
jgi:hypothetical protein